MQSYYEKMAPGKDHQYGVYNHMIRHSKMGESQKHPSQ